MEKEPKLLIREGVRDVGLYNRSVADRIWETRERLELDLVRSLIQRQVIQTGSISGADPAQLPLVVDYSHWNGDVDMSLIAGFAEAVFCKACDGQQMYDGSATDLGNYVDKTFHANVDKAYRIDVPCVPYIYVYWKKMADAGYSNHGIAMHHYNVFKQALGTLIPGKSFHGLAIDVEERNGTGPNVAEIVLTLFKMLADDVAFAGMPIFIYTSMSILNLYTNLREQISWAGANYNGRPYYLWLAQWAWTPTPRIQTSWQELRSKYVNPLIMRIIVPGSTVCTFLQFAANFNLPGCSINITDLSFYIGTLENMYKLLRFTKRDTTPPPPQTSDLEKRIAALETTVGGLVSDNTKLKDVLRTYIGV